MIQITEVFQPNQKKNICSKILHALPQWFAMESGITEYMEAVQTLTFYAASDMEQPVGFIAIKKHNEYTSEIYVMGILESYQRQRIGHRLISKCKEYLVDNGAKYLTVKTLADSACSEAYARTRQFYTGTGFLPLEVFPSYWDADNPCLYMILDLDS